MFLNLLTKRGYKIKHKNKDPKMNRAIKSAKVMLIDESGVKHGIVNTSDALARAEKLGLDLVEVSESPQGTICKILDYGKIRYQKEKQKKINKKKQHVINVKEIRIRPNTGDHDLLTKLMKAKKFLNKGDKLKVTIMFRGREMARRDLGFQMLERVKNVLEDISKIDKDANMEGRRLSIILSPK